MTSSKINVLITVIIIVILAGCTQAGPSGPTSGESRTERVDELAEGEGETTAPESEGDTDLPSPQQPPPTVTPQNTPDQATVTPKPAPMAELDLNSSDFAVPIYAAAVRRVYNHDFSFGDEAEFSLVYIISTTADGAGLEVPLTPPQTLSPALQQALTDELAEQPFEIIWVSSVEDVPVDAQGRIAEGEGIYILLGNILPQADGTMHLPFFMVCGPLCLTGKTYVLSEVDGVWQVTGNVGVAIQG